MQQQQGAGARHLGEHRRGDGIWHTGAHRICPGDAVVVAAAFVEPPHGGAGHEEQPARRVLHEDGFPEPPLLLMMRLHIHPQSALAWRTLPGAAVVVREHGVGAARPLVLADVGNAVVEFQWFALEKHGGTFSGYRSAPARASDQKRQIDGTSAHQLTMSAAQTTQVNAWLRVDLAKARSLLASSQARQLR